MILTVREDLEKPLKISLCCGYSTGENLSQHTTATAAFHSQVYESEHFQKTFTVKNEGKCTVPASDYVSLLYPDQNLRKKL